MGECLIRAIRHSPLLFFSNLDKGNFKYPNFPINPRAHYSSKTNFWVRINQNVGVREVIRGRALLIHPFTPKSGVYDFCIFKTADLAKILENFHQIHSFEATKMVNHSFWGSRKFLTHW